MSARLDRLLRDYFVAQSLPEHDLARLQELERELNG